MITDAEIADTVVLSAVRSVVHTTGQWVHPDGGYVHLDPRTP
jgi:hypothetical protein